MFRRKNKVFIQVRVERNEELEELSASIEMEGVISPLIVRPLNRGGYTEEPQKAD